MGSRTVYSWFCARPIEGDFVDNCTGNFPIMSLGDQAAVSSMRRHGERKLSIVDLVVVYYNIAVVGMFWP